MTISLSTSTRLLLVSCALLMACGDDGASDTPIDAGIPDAEPVKTFEECGSSDQAFVRSAHLALLGSRPKSQAQVNVYADLMASIRRATCRQKARTPARRRPRSIHAKLSQPCF